VSEMKNWLFKNRSKFGGWSYSHGMPMVFIKIQRVFVLSLFLLMFYMAISEFWLPLFKVLLK
jgi:hypothetical protein